jgi:predicted DNA-binding transcriptional regulator YafY
MGVFFQPVEAPAERCGKSPMNRTDRLLAIVLELQARGKQRAEDLAETFETSKRTIYRDIQALCEAGVPVVAIPGQGYALLEGYFLPPLSLTPDEATVLLLGAGVMEKSFDPEYGRAATRAARKIAGALTDAQREKVQHLQQSIWFAVPGVSSQDEIERLQQLRHAISQQQTVSFDYQAKDGREVHNREVDPYGLVHHNNTWYLEAYCHLRQTVRTFRLSRMAYVQLMPQTFTPSEYDWRAKHEQSFQSRDMVIRLLFDEQAVGWVKEDRFFYIVNREETSEGLLVTLAVRQIREILRWVMGWGHHVRVLEPESLRQLVLEEAQALLANYQEVSALKISTG